MKSRWLSLWHIRPFYNKSLARNLHVLFIDQNFNSISPSIERSTLSWNPLSLLNLDNQYIINPLSLHAILNFSFFFATFRFRKISFRFVSIGFVSFWFRFVSFRSVFISLRTLQVPQKYTWNKKKTKNKVSWNLSSCKTWMPLV